MKRKFSFLSLLTAVSFLFVLVSCDNSEEKLELSSKGDLSKALAGPFVWKMNHHGNTKCPTKGRGCGKSSSASLDPSALGALDFAVAQGSNGVQSFFMTGPYSAIFPGLREGQPEIYADLVSGQFSGLRESRNNDVIYSFGKGTFSFETGNYHFVVND